MDPSNEPTADAYRSRIASRSRRSLLRVLAASGSLAAVGGVASGQAQDQEQTQDDTDATATDDIPVAGEFPEGETVGLQPVAQNLPAPTDMDYVDVDGDVYHFIATQTGQVFVTNLHERAGGAGSEADGTDTTETDAETEVTDDETDAEPDANATDETESDAETDETDAPETDAESSTQQNGAAGDVAQEFTFSGVIQAWIGQGPDEITNVENPTLELEAGETYRITWENGDGQPHNVVILDAGDNILERTEIIREQGETQTLEFEATEEMDRYVCEVHPGTMVGRVQVDEGDETDQADQQPTETAAADGLTPDDMDLFLDIEDRLVSLGIGELGGYDERGLLGIAFHPDFAENGRFYVRYSAPEQEGLGYNHTDVLAEFTADDLETADPDSERTIMTVQQPQDNHNGGRLAFGPDGYLYASYGDGGNVHDIGIGHEDDWYDENEGGNAQNTSDTALGGIHRIDVDTAEEAALGEYGIPEDNPLVDAEGHYDEYYAWGFRNPWGMSIDDDGQLFVTDAGQHHFESVYAVERGGNYSWNVKEGSFCFSTENPLEPPEDCPDEVGEAAGEARAGEPLLDPIAEYEHTRVSEAFIDSSTVTGGHRYAGDAIPELEDAFVFGNWSSQGVAEADGEVLMAVDPSTGTGAGDDVDTETDGDEGEIADTEDNETAITGTEDNETAITDTEDNETTITDTEDNETTITDTDDDDAAIDGDTAGSTDLVGVDERWDLAELQFEGADDESMNRYVYGVERDEEGELYVLANTDYRPDPETGEIYKIVPADEGDEVPAPEDPATVDPADRQDEPDENGAPQDDGAPEGTDDGTDTDATDAEEDDPEGVSPDDTAEDDEAFPQDEGEETETDANETTTEQAD